MIVEFVCEGICIEGDYEHNWKQVNLNMWQVKLCLGGEGAWKILESFEKKEKRRSIKEKYMEIRKLTINDYEEIYDLWMSTPGMGLNDIDDSKAGIEKYLKRNPDTCFVAVMYGKIVGVILSGHDGRRGYIYHTAVSIASRNRGIGSALVDAALKALKDKGIHKVALVVFERNEIGNTFWEQKGFSTRGDLNYKNKALKELNRIDT